MTEEKRQDPWKHRSAGMQCRTCMWFVNKTRGKTVDAESEPADGKPLRSFGRCRRHAPTLQGYPAVFGDDWCGDHKLDENAV